MLVQLRFKATTSCNKVQSLVPKRSSIYKNVCFGLSYRGPDFRPDYGRLGVLAALFPNVPTAALIATATLADRTEIIKTLYTLSPKQVIGNLDQTNIFYEKVLREVQDTVAYEGIHRPIAEALL